MKIVKVIIIALVTVLSFSAAEAQVRVRATIGSRQVYHRRTVVVRRGPVYRRGYYRRPVYRPHYRPHYYRRPVYRPHYYRHH